MIPPVEINLPSGLRIMMYPRPARYRWWPFGKVDEGESEQELFRRFAAAVRSVDFDAVANLYDPPYAPTNEVGMSPVLHDLFPALKTKARKPKKKKDDAIQLDLVDEVKT